MQTDHVADLLARLRNAYKAQLQVVTAPHSMPVVQCSRVCLASSTTSAISAEAR